MAQFETPESLFSSRILNASSNKFQNTLLRRKQPRRRRKPKSQGSEDLTETLIDVKKDKEHLFQRKRGVAPQIWKNISEELASRTGVLVSPKKCRKKWDNLLAKYKKLKKPPTGTSTEDGELDSANSWRYYDKLDSFLGDRHNIRPPYLVDTLLPTPSVRDLFSSQHLYQTQPTLNDNFDIEPTDHFLFGLTTPIHKHKKQKSSSSSHITVHAGPSSSSSSSHVTVHPGPSSSSSHITVHAGPSSLSSSSSLSPTTVDHSSPVSSSSLPPSHSTSNDHARRQTAGTTTTRKRKRGQSEEDHLMAVLDQQLDLQRREVEALEQIAQYFGKMVDKL